MISRLCTFVEAIVASVRRHGSINTKTDTLLSNQPRIYLIDCSDKVLHSVRQLRRTKHVLHRETRHSLCTQADAQQHIRQVYSTNIASTCTDQRGSFMSSHVTKDRCRAEPHYRDVRAVLRCYHGLRNGVPIRLEARLQPYSGPRGWRRVVEELQGSAGVYILATGNA